MFFIIFRFIIINGLYAPFVPPILEIEVPQQIKFKMCNANPLIKLHRLLIQEGRRSNGATLIDNIFIWLLVNELSSISHLNHVNQFLRRPCYNIFISIIVVLFHLSCNITNIFQVINYNYQMIENYIRLYDVYWYQISFHDFVMFRTSMHYRFPKYKLYQQPNVKYLIWS